MNLYKIMKKGAIYVQVFIRRFVQARPILEIPRRKQFPMLYPKIGQTALQMFWEKRNLLRNVAKNVGAIIFFQKWKHMD